jgi:hypothetical protein
LGSPRDGPAEGVKPSQQSCIIHQAVSLAGNDAVAASVSDLENEITLNFIPTLKTTPLSNKNKLCQIIRLKKDELVRKKKRCFIFLNEIQLERVCVKNFD